MPKHKWIWIILRGKNVQRFYSTGLGSGSYCSAFTSYRAAHKVLIDERCKCYQQANDMYEIEKPQKTAYDFWMGQAAALKVYRVSLSDTVTDEDLAAIARLKKKGARQ